MGAGQIGGIATLLDIDFNNAAGFQGVDAVLLEGQFITYYLSHALLFCMGALIEPHVVLTPAICVYGEKYKFEIYAGTHKFLRNAGVPRIAEHVCFHKAYNHTKRWTDCSAINLGLLVLNKPYSLHQREPYAEFVINRLRYGSTPSLVFEENGRGKCHYYGFGSRRNGYLIPLLINLRKAEVVILPTDRCASMWNNERQFLCIEHIPCKSEKYGALCPDDVGSIIECSGYAVGMMVSRLIDRPCGIGFIDLQKNNKFLTCGVDDSRDVITQEPYLSFDYNTSHKAPPTPNVRTVPPNSIRIGRKQVAYKTVQSIDIEDTATTTNTFATSSSPRKAIPEHDNDKSYVNSHKFFSIFVPTSSSTISTKTNTLHSTTTMPSSTTKTTTITPKA